MPLAVERGDVVLHDRPVAGAALGREHVEVVVPAVGLPLLLVEALLAELLAALGAEEVLHVPRLLQGRDAFLQVKQLVRALPAGADVRPRWARCSTRIWG